MKRSVHWILWLTLILIFILIFPKSCGNKIQVSEENKNIISEENQANNTDNNIDESILNNNESTIYDENNTEILYDEAMIDGNIIDESNLDSNTTQKYNCYGFWDGLIAKINKNSSIQWCYGICMITPEEIKNNKEIKNQTGDDSIASGIFASFSNLALVLGIIVGAIIILGIIKYILNKLESLNK